MNIEGIFGIFAVACGLYCLYGYVMIKTKKKVNRTILLPKDVDVKKCKDLDAYCKEASLPLLVLGLSTTLYGVSDLYNTYVGGADKLFTVILILFFVALVFFIIRVRKCNQKYFGI